MAGAPDPSHNTDKAVVCQAVAYAYGQHKALKSVDLSVAHGEIFGLLGPNGGGKSTLFRLLSTLVPMQAGHVSILGHDVERARTEVRKRLGVVFQSPALDLYLTVAENLRHHGHLYGLRGRDLAARIDRGLEAFGLRERRKQRARELSGGLRRRVEIAKSLLHDPEVLILDEPSTGLDPGARRDLWSMLENVRTTRRVTVMLTSHILEEAEGCDRIAILDRGNLVTSGSPAQLKQDIGGDVVTIQTNDLAGVADAIAARFGVQAQVLDHKLRLEHSDGGALLRQIVETFGDDIESVKLSKPTLEDVFIRATGHAFWTVDVSAAGAAVAPQRSQAPQLVATAREAR